MLHPVLAHQAPVLWLNESRWALFKWRFLTHHWNLAFKCQLLPRRKDFKFTVTVNAYKTVRPTDAGSMCRITVRTVHQGRYWRVKNGNMFKGTRKQHCRFCFFASHEVLKGWLFLFQDYICGSCRIHCYLWREERVGEFSCRKQHSPVYHTANGK